MAECKCDCRNNYRRCSNRHSRYEQRYSHALRLLTAIAYAVYFDHRRRTDPEFRRELKRQSRRAARFDRSQAEAASSAHKQAIRDALAEAKTADYPTSNEEREMFFMEQVGQGERLSTDGRLLSSENL